MGVPREDVKAWSVPGFSGEAAAAPPAFLEELFRLDPERWLRRIGGRETFAWPGRPEWIVKRTIGGEARDYWFERFRGSARSPARREAETLAALGREGLRVPRPLAWVEERAAVGHPRRAGRSALVMERIEFTESLRTCVEHAPRSVRDDLSRRLGALVARLHGRGWIHRDLYLQHVVVAADGELVLLDVARARQSDAHRRRWFVKDLAALQASTPAVVSRAERARFLARWLAARGVEGREPTRRWTRSVLAKARRLGAHRPRHLDPQDPVDAELLARGGEAP